MVFLKVTGDVEVHACQEQRNNLAYGVHGNALAQSHSAQSPAHKAVILVGNGGGTHGVAHAEGIGARSGNGGTHAGVGYGQRHGDGLVVEDGGKGRVASDYNRTCGIGVAVVPVQETETTVRCGSQRGGVEIGVAARTGNATQQGVVGNHTQRVGHRGEMGGSVERHVGHVGWHYLCDGIDSKGVADKACIQLPILKLVAVIGQCGSAHGVAYGKVVVVGLGNGVAHSRVGIGKDYHGRVGGLVHNLHIVHCCGRLGAAATVVGPEEDEIVHTRSGDGGSVDAGQPRGLLV